MMWHKLYFILMVLTGGMLNAQVIARFEVKATNAVGELEIPVCISIDKLTKLQANQLKLSEVIGKKKIETASQLDNARTMHWLVKFHKNETSKVFILTKGNGSLQDKVNAVKDEKNLTIAVDGKNLLRYVHGIMYPPVGVDSSYRRSGFIHPLWTLHGQELTRIQPKDHYHHYGIWNPWTHVLYKGDTVDFWNIGEKKATVRSAGFQYIVDGSVFSEYKVLHEHVVTKNNTTAEVAINEWQTVRVYRPEAEKNYYFVDFIFDMSCATENPVTLLTYRYGGLGWRTTEKWDNKNSEVITSEGKNRKEADGTTARWCIVQGALDNDYGGIVMMSHPSNYNHPEPLRIWPENQYDRGDMFANFSPTKNKDWLLVPGQHYVLKYRFLVFNGQMLPERAEDAWKSFSDQPTVTSK